MKRVPFIERVPIRLKDTNEENFNDSSCNPMDMVNSIDSSSVDVFDLSDIRLAIDDAYARRFPSIWALKYKPLKNRPLTFKSSHNPYNNRPWQRQILDDNHPNKVVEKSRQLGLSELSVTEVVHFLACHPQTKVMYTFPTYHQMNDFSVSRVAPVFNDSPYLKGLLSKEVNNVSTKKIGHSYLFMRSSSSGSIGEGVDADSA